MKKLVFGILIALFTFSFSYSQEKQVNPGKGPKKPKRVCVTIEKEKCKDCKECENCGKELHGGRHMVRRQGPPPQRIGYPGPGHPRSTFQGPYFMRDTTNKK